MQRKSNSWISFRCRITANFHLLQIPSISHSRQALLPCAVVYLMNLRIPPKPAIKAMHFETEIDSSVCTMLKSLKWSRFFSLIWLRIVHFLTWIYLIYFPPNAAVMSRPFAFRGRRLAWEIFLIAPLVSSNSSREIKLSFKLVRHYFFPPKPRTFNLFHTIHNMSVDGGNLRLL